MYLYGRCMWKYICVYMYIYICIYIYLFSLLFFFIWYTFSGLFDINLGIYKHIFASTCTFSVFLFCILYRIVLYLNDWIKNTHTHTDCKQKMEILFMSCHTLSLLNYDTLLNIVNCMRLKRDDTVEGIIFLYDDGVSHLRLMRTSHKED